MKWLLALITALAAGQGAWAQSGSALTFEYLYAVSPQEAARRVFGPTSDVFVERPYWDAAEPSQVEFFTKATPIAPGVCSVSRGWATFDTSMPKDLSDEDKAAWSNLSFSLRPLRLWGVGHEPRYFAAGPAKAAFVEPAKKPRRPGTASVADGCEGPVASRGPFVAPSAEAAILLVSTARTVIAAARGRKPLPFRIEGECLPGLSQCDTKRTLLQALQLSQIHDVQLDEGCRGWRRARLPAGAKRCLSFTVGVPTHYNWTFDFVFGPTRLSKVFMSVEPERFTP